MSKIIVTTILLFLGKNKFAMQYPMQALRPGLQLNCQVDKLILEQSTPGKAIRYLGGSNGFIVHTLPGPKS